MGKGKKPGDGGAGGSEHISRPLTTLKDPSLFGPPPRNVNYHGGIALPNEITPHTGGLGAPLTQTEIQAARGPTQEQIEAEQEAEAEAARRAGPPLPYRADRTGLKTDHLPPPPLHRAIAQSANNGTPEAVSKPRPNLPPRLPSRKDSSTNESTSSLPIAQPPVFEAAAPQPQPTPVQHPVQPTAQSNSWLNQGAANRLGKAGISVPGLGIGESNPWKGETTKTTSPPPVATNNSGLNELQSRFARMNSGAATSPQTAPAEGTTLEQKQAAFKTAQNFHKDPSTVTMADAQSAASTVNNFRARHQDQISAGAQKANGWNKKFNVTGRVNSFLEKQASPVSEQPPAEVPATVTSPTPANINRKPPPPPPPKKPSGMHAPPPVPLGTKPSFG
jgi:hypothetical protein